MTEEHEARIGVALYEARHLLRKTTLLPSATAHRLREPVAALHHAHEALADALCDAAGRTDCLLVAVEALAGALRGQLADLEGGR